MGKKSDLLKEMGWSEDLINHFMISDSVYSESPEQELVAEVYDSHSLKVSFSAESVCSNYVAGTAMQPNDGKK